MVRAAARGVTRMPGQMPREFERVLMQRVGLEPARLAQFTADYSAARDGLDEPTPEMVQQMETLWQQLSRTEGKP